MANREHFSADLPDFYQNFKSARVGKLSRDSVTGAFETVLVQIGILYYVRPLTYNAVHMTIICIIHLNHM